MAIQTKFQEKLNKITIQNNSLLCVGLDTELEKIPEHIKNGDEPLFTFNKTVIDATADLVCAYKPNIAFYEAYGLDGLSQLKKTIEYIHVQYAGIPVILDAKRTDVPNTARMYAKAVYEYWDADATTVLPHLGQDTLEPFFAYNDRCTILLIKTSNPDSGKFADAKTENQKPLYLLIAETVKTWNEENLGLFVGATYPEELANIRKLFPTSPILTAGIGAQGAKTESAVKAGIDSEGNNLICNNSREIIYAGNGEDFAQEAREKAQELRDSINIYRSLA